MDSKSRYSKRIDRVIVGSESGTHARPMNPLWASGLHHQCALAGVPFFFKQWGGTGHDKGGGLLGGSEVKASPMELRR
jgi:protein gp37